MFTQANLSNSQFSSSTLTDADLTNAVVVGAIFDNTTSRGFTQQQLYSTASYKNHDLSGISLNENNLTGWSFTRQNLTNAYFYSSTLSEADMRQANLSNTSYWNSTLTCANLSQANLTNADFDFSTLTDADLTDAVIAGAIFNTSEGFTKQQLYSTASYKNHDLSRVGLEHRDLTGGRFAGQNLTNTDFMFSTLNSADLTDAIVAGAHLGFTTSEGFTQEQLYSTASYKQKDLSGIHLNNNDLCGWGFVGQTLAKASFVNSTMTSADLRRANLTLADFTFSTLVGADLTAADTRGAHFSLTNGTATKTNTILVDGRLDGLELGVGHTLFVRDYDGIPDAFLAKPPLPIHVERHFAMHEGGTLQLLFETDAWDSTISFASDIPVTLGGTLSLDFVEGVDITTQIGRTFNLFDSSG